MNIQNVMNATHLETELPLILNIKSRFLIKINK